MGLEVNQQNSEQFQGKNVKICGLFRSHLSFVKINTDLKEQINLTSRTVIQAVCK
jgi:hypothetical protein